MNLDPQLLSQALSGHTLPPSPPHVLIAAFPKSGSTLLGRVIGALPGMAHVSLVPGYGHREQELDAVHLTAFHRRPYVARHHVRYSETTREYIRIFHLKPVILVRNIFDCVMSMDGHLCSEGPDMPIQFVPPAYASWPEARRHQFIIEMMMPWYFNFFALWRLAPSGAFLTYEALISNKLKAVADIAAHAGLKVDMAACQQAIRAAESTNTRRNVGRVGRGQDLSKANRDRLRAMADHFPETDFRLIGLD